MLFPGWAFALNPAVGAHNINTAAIAANTYTTASATITAGSTITVAVGTGAATGCTVTGASTYTVPTLGSGTNPIHETNDGSYLWVFTAVNATGGSQTAAVSCPDTIWDVNLVEVQNVPTTSPIDASASLYSGTSPMNLPVTTTAANDIVFGFGYSAAGTAGRNVTFTGSGFSALDSYNDATTTLNSADLTAATTGAHDPTYNRTGGVIAGITIAFKPASGGSSCTHTAYVKGTGALTVPTAGSTLVYRQDGSWGTVDCLGTGSSDKYWTTQLGGNFVGN